MFTDEQILDWLDERCFIGIRECCDERPVSVEFRTELGNDVPLGLREAAESAMEADDEWLERQPQGRVAESVAAAAPEIAPELSTYQSTSTLASAGEREA